MQNKVNAAVNNCTELPWWRGLVAATEETEGSFWNSFSPLQENFEPTWKSSRLANVRFSSFLS
jgi:hypothetical protein